MKKMKKLLAGLASVAMMLGTMGMSTFADEVRNEYGRTLSEQALYDAENAKEKLAQLLAKLEEMGYTENEQTKFLETYIEGALEVAASGATYGESTDEEWKDIELNYSTIGNTIYTENAGTFESGVTYFYNEETKGLVFDGKGELSAEDYSSVMNSFNNIEFIFFGKDVTFECRNGARFIAFYNTFNENWYDIVKRPLIPTYTYEGSEFTRQFDECMKEIGANEDIYKYYTVEDDTDPYTFVNPLPALPTYITDGGLFWNVDETHTSPSWYYEGTVYDGVSKGILLITSIHNDPYTLEDVLKVVGDYTVTEVYLDENMAVLPAELQNCATIEEAEAELLRLINEAKTDEQPTEQTISVLNFGTPTIAGDLNLDNEQGITDIVMLTKYNANSMLYPITDPTALANADVNKDSSVNSIDTNILIEKLLNGFENAV